MESDFDDIDRNDSRLARERVLADLKSLVRDSEDLLKATAGDMSEKAKEARKRVTAALQRAKATCDNWQEQTLETAKATARQADIAVRNHPYESVGIAFGIGLLVGCLVPRK